MKHEQKVGNMNNYPTYSDEELLPVMREQKPARDFAFDVIYKRYSCKLNSYCIFLTRNKSESEEIFHQTWINFFEYVVSGNSINNILPFLINSAKNIYFNKIKSIGREIKRMEEFTYITEMDSMILQNKAIREDKDKISMIHVAVDSLDDKYREPFILKRYHELPNEEIAKICNETAECIRKRITRATQKVREIIYGSIKEKQK